LLLRILIQKPFLIYQSNNKESCSLDHDLSPGNFNKIFKVWKIAFGTNQNTIDLTFVLNFKKYTWAHMSASGTACLCFHWHAPLAYHARTVKCGAGLQAIQHPVHFFSLIPTEQPPSLCDPTPPTLLFSYSHRAATFLLPHHCPLQPTEAPSSKNSQWETPVSTATNARFFAGETLLRLSFPHWLRPVRPPLFLEQGWFHWRG
jgi:hypothetical protein